MTSEASAVRRTRAALGRALWLKYALAGSTAWLFAWGLMVLVGRAVWRVDRLPMAWGVVGLVLAAGVGWWLARRRVPGATAVRAALDNRSRAGGLIMACGEDGDGEGALGGWASRVPAVGPVTVRYRGGRAWLLLTAAAAFVAVGFALPDQLAAINAPNRLNVDEPVERLRGQLATLEAEKLIEPEAADSLEAQLERVANESSASSPARTLAALDAIERELERTAEASASEAVREAEQLDAVAGAAEAASAAAKAAEGRAGAEGEASEAAGKELAARMRELARRIEAAKAESKALREALDPELAKRLAAMAKLDEAALGELAKLDAEAAQALKALEEQMEAVAPDALAWVDGTGTVRVLDPDEKTRAAAMKDARRKLERAHALRVGTGKVFEHDPEVMLFADLSAWGEGERIVAMHEVEGMAVFEHEPDAKVERAKIEASGGADVVHLVEPDGTVRRYKMDAAASRAMQAARNGMQGKERAMRIAEAAQRAAGQGRGEMREAMERMRAAGLLEGPAGRRLIAAMQGRQAARAGVNRPGRGGINRGRGDAPMTWRDPGAEEKVEMRSEMLPTGAARSLDEAPTVGVSAAAPDAYDPSVEAGTGALRGAAAGGGSAARERVLPQHRAAVERYFERD